MTTTSNLSTIVFAVAPCVFAAAASAQLLVPTAQSRQVYAEADAFQCVAEIMTQGVVAPGFGLFDESVTIDNTCGRVGAMASADQLSTIRSSRLAAAGTATADTLVDEFDFLLAMSDSTYLVDFDVTAPLRIRLAGDLGGNAQSPVVPSIWVIASARLLIGNTPIFDREVLPVLNGGPASDTFEQVQRLEPGSYTLWVRANAIITDAIPATGSFESSYDVALDAFDLADLDLDGTVGVVDLLHLLAQWGPCPPGGPCLADLDQDGLVTVSDLLRLLSAWS